MSLGFRAVGLTTNLLVLPSQSILLLPGLVQLVGDALDLSHLDAQIPLGLLIDQDGLVQPCLDLDVDALELLGALLELPSSAVCLLQVDYEDLDLNDREVY